MEKDEAEKKRKEDEENAKNTQKSVSESVS